VIGRLRGTLVRKALPSIVVEAGGVGYEVRLSLGAFEALPPEGGEALFEVVTLFRNEALELYGFASVAEKDLFNTLLGVSGVGPKTALALLSALPVREVVAALRSERALVFERVPGIGRKTAQRLVLELKDKVGAFDETAVPASGRRPGAAARPLDEDAVNALLNLGYRRADAERAVEAVAAEGETVELAALIRGALRRIAGRN
jgi:Holliday junction DNA helicase RuvA